MAGPTEKFCPEVAGWIGDKGRSVSVKIQYKTKDGEYKPTNYLYKPEKCREIAKALLLAANFLEGDNQDRKRPTQDDAVLGGKNYKLVRDEQSTDDDIPF